MPEAPRPKTRQPRLEEFGTDGLPPDPLPGPRLRTRPPALPGIWPVADGQLRPPLLRDGVLRALPFQLHLALIALSEDLVVVLPTGLGKTVIAALVAAELLRSGEGKLLFLAPTRPLVQQHAASFERWFVGLRIA